MILFEWDYVGKRQLSTSVLDRWRQQVTYSIKVSENQFPAQILYISLEYNSVLMFVYNITYRTLPLVSVGHVLMLQLMFQLAS